MTIEDKQTLKSYFESGDTPTQVQFSILIDSLLGIEDDLIDDLVTDSDVKALSARQGVALKAIVDTMGLRVSSIEELNSTTLQDYLLKVDLGAFLAGKAEVAHTHLASNITDLLDVVYSKSQVDALIANYSVESHGHAISDITGLQDALDGVDDLGAISSLRSDLEASIGGKADTGHQHTESDITDLKNYLESATASVLLQSKAELSHTHLESQITDLDKYKKSEVDALFAGVVSDGSVPAHTHTEANISDLDKYNKSEVDQKIEDSKQTLLTAHLSEDNPHGIDKDDIGLGNVPNLSQADLLKDATIENPSFTGTITGLDGAAIGLPNVPNVNVLELLNTHLQDTANPHEVVLSDFDAFSRAETESKIQEILEIFRTVHVGDLPQEGTGSTGLITQRDIWDRIKDINFDPTDNKNTIGGSLEATGDLGIGGSIESTTGDLELGGKSLGDFKVIISDELDIANDATIGGSGSGEEADLKVYGTISPNNTVKALTGDLILEGKDSDDVRVNDNLKVTGNINATDGDLILQGKADSKVVINDDLDITGSTTLKGTTLGTSSTNADLTVNGNTTISGNLTVNGTTTSIDTTNLEIEDNMVVLNKNQAGSPANNLQSGIEVERGSASNARLFFDETTGRWKAEIVSGSSVVIKTIAFVEDAYAQG
jgi:hypothetical protein